MILKFSNGKTFDYLSAIAVERDYKNGWTRPSIEIALPLERTSYGEIESLVNSNAVGSFTLTGDTPDPVPVFKTRQTEIDGVTATVNVTDENGNPAVDYYEQPPAPVSTYTDYTIPGRISVEDGVITFKVYRLSDTEIENIAAKRAIDELLIAMEV